MLGLTTSYIVEFDIAAFVLTLMLLFTLYSRRSFPTVAIKQYKHLLFCNLISSVADFISAYSIYNTSVVPLPVNYLINIVFLLSHNFTGIFFMMYVIAAIRGNLGTKRERVLWISLFSVLSVLILSTPFTKLVFYFDENTVYSHGNLLFVLYLVMIISLFYSLYLMTRYRMKMSSFQISTNLGFYILNIAAISFQAFFPNYLLENFCIAIACPMMNLTLDNPATYFYLNTGCYNQSAFDATMDKKLTDGDTFSLVGFTYDDLSVFRKLHSEADYDELISVTIRRCQGLVGSKRCFILQDSSFVILRERADDGFISTLEAVLSRPVSLSDGTKTSVVPHFCILQFPGEVKTVGNVTLVIQDMLYHIYRKSGEHIIRDTTDLLNDQRREDSVVHLLRNTVRNNDIIVYFQPLYSPKTGKFDCAEALVRLRDNPDHLSPDEFIPLAEKNGLILDIGRSVLEKVCRFISESHCEACGIDHINVNLSMLQLINTEEVNKLIDICRGYGVSPARIIFEVTETATEGSDYGHVAENIRALKNAGFSLSLDDYGTGYSNIVNLTRFPFDQIKIDKSLLWDAMKDEDSMTILKSTVTLVKGFGKRCVAEGVETESMAELLTELDVDLFQGYLYSKPISAVSFLAFLQEKNRKE